jgi:hypothetical protein
MHPHGGHPAEFHSWHSKSLHRGIGHTTVIEGLVPITFALAAYCSVGSVCTLTKRIVYIFYEMIFFFLVLKLLYFPSSIVIL